ncbi:MAG: adenylate/guanylate cyclase domain-containing protein [Betaproteobacteria bacterium]
MADVFGYSRMMGEAEERTVRTFRGHRAVFDELLKAHRGRIFNTAGDAILAEFPSAVEAVRCATEIQAALRTRNEQLPEAQRMWFRIGINLGDVIVQGGDLLGDGVNVAARIQTVAEPGGVCISGSVYDQIQNKLTLQIRQLGEKKFKNIAQPVRTFSISDADGSALPSGARWRGQPGARLAARTGIGVLVFALAAGAYWLYTDREGKAAEQARLEQTQRAADMQRKAELDKAVSQKEAKLLAELQSAKDALTQAEASKRKAEQERVAAETAQREARMQGELKAAKDALVRAEQNEKQANDARKAANAALETAAGSAGKSADAQRRLAAPASGPGAAKATTEPKAEPKSVAEPKAPAQVAIAPHSATHAAAKGSGRWDGAYPGRMCTTNLDRSPRCWDVILTVHQGTLAAAWASSFSSEPSRLRGTIASDGVVKIELEGHSTTGRPIRGTASGALAGNTMTVSGAWGNNAPITGTWSLNP